MYPPCIDGRIDTEAFMSIPFTQLNISPVTQEKLQSSDVTNKMQLAQGQGCTSDEEALSVLMILSQDDDASVSAVAKGSFASCF